MSIRSCEDRKIGVAMPHRGNPHGLGPIVGREQELAATEAFIAGAGPAALVIDGPPGIGKTTLWRAGVDRALAHGRRVLRARPVQAEAEMAFAGLDALFGDVVDAVVHQLPGPQRAALEVALLRAPARAAAIEPRTVAGATLSTLRALAAGEPLLLAIDDMQWLDRSTVRALQIALSRLADEAVRVLAATRPLSSTPELGLERVRVSVIELGGLDAESLRALARERLGASLSLPAARRLAELSGGNPYFALELLDSGDPEHGFELGASTDLKRLVGRRLSAIPGATRVALGTLAATSSPSAALVSRLLGDEAVLEPAFAAGLLEHSGRRLRFAHPLLAAASYQALSPARRRAVHGRLAKLAGDEVEHARHLAAAAAEPDAAVATRVEAGGAAAAARGAPGVAAALFENAAELTPTTEPDRAAARRLEAARQLFAAGEGRRALDRCAVLLDKLPAGELRADVLTTMAGRGKLPLARALAMCEQAVSECDRAGARARCLLLLSNVVQTHDAERALDCARQALATLGDGGDPSLRAWALGMLGAYNVFGEPAGDGIELLREAAELERERGSQAPDVYLEARTQLGFALMWRDELDEARELLAAQHDRATLAGQEAGASTVALHLAELEIRAGRLEPARAYAQDALALEDEGEDTQTLGSLLYVRAHVAALEGEVELATTLAQRGLAVGRAVGDGIFPMHNRWVLGTLALALGDAERAVEHLRSLPAECEALGFLEPGSGPFTSDCLDALIAAGRVDEADAMCARWEALGTELDRPRLLATGARARGLIAAGRGDLDSGLASLERALAEHERLPVPHERARTLLAYGTTLRRAGRRRDARAALGKAATAFESIGQPLWAQRARDESRRLAGRRPEGGDLAAPELTVAELRVAELVAAGHTNREVADTLFITVRTVEANLTRIYRKLDLRSRAELAARWQEPPAGGGSATAPDPAARR